MSRAVAVVFTNSHLTKCFSLSKKLMVQSGLASYAVPTLFLSEPSRLSHGKENSTSKKNTISPSMIDDSGTQEIRKAAAITVNDLHKIIMQLSADFVTLTPALMEDHFESILQAVAVTLNASDCTLLLFDPDTSTTSTENTRQAARYETDSFAANASNIRWMIPVTYNYTLSGYLQVSTSSEFTLIQEIADLLKLLASLIANIVEAMKKSTQHQESLIQPECHRVTIQNFSARLSSEGIITQADQAMSDFSGTALEELEGRLAWEISCWKNSHIATARIKNAVAMAKEGRLVQYSTFLADETGNSVQLEISLRPKRDASGRVTTIMLEAQQTDVYRSLQQAPPSSKPVTLQKRPLPNQVSKPFSGLENPIRAIEPILRKLLANALHYQLLQKIPIIKVASEVANQQTFVTLFYNQPEPDFKAEHVVSRQEADLSTIRFQNAIPDRLAFV